MSRIAREHKFLYQQDQPQVICQEPETPPLEYNTGNAFYGIGDILREYARLPQEAALPFAVEHFVPYLIEQIHERDVADGLPVFLATTPQRAKAYEAAGMPKAVAVGFVLFYAIRLYQRRHGRRAAPRRGTIVFPHKSTRDIRREFNHDTFADWLLTLPPEFHPVVVNLYWADYRLGKQAVYESRGLKVVSCGHLYDNQFLLRFYDLCRQFRYACGNSFASSFPLSVLCGCQFFYKDTFGHKEYFENLTTHFKEDPTLQGPLAREALALSPYPPRADGLTRQLAFARKLTGHRHVRSGWTLRRLHRAAYRLLLAARGTGLDLSESVPRRLLHPWLPQGIHEDGWLEPQSSLVIPPPGIHSSVILVLEFPGWAGHPRQAFEVFAADVKLGKVEMLPGIHTLTVHPPPGRRDRRISLRAEASFCVSDHDARRVCARLIRFHLGGSLPQTGKSLVLQTFRESHESGQSR